MSAILEVFGRAIGIDTAQLIWHWLDTTETASQPKDLSEIVDLIGQMDLDAADAQLTLYLSNNPTCQRGHLAAAAVLLHKNDLPAAVQQLDAVYVQQPNNTMALYALGHCYERLGREAEAVEFYQDCLKFKNYLELPAQRLAAIYLKNGQLEQAIEQYKLLHEQHPDDISALVTLGHLYLATTRYAKAAETFDTAILIHPDSFHATDDLDLLIGEGQLQEALEEIAHLLEREPDRPDLVVKQADVLGALGATADAVSQYQRALRACPDFLEAAIKLGTLYLQMGAEQLAAEQFSRAVEINDRIVDAYVGLAVSQKLAGRDSDALATLSLAAAIHPNSPFLFSEAAKLVFKAVLAHAADVGPNGDPLDATTAVINAHFKQSRQGGRDPDLHYRLGVLMMGVGQISQAIRCFEAALDANPTFARARTKLAVCLFESDRGPEAMELLAKPEPLDRDTLGLHYKVALLYCDKLKFASSLMNLQHSLEQNFAGGDAVVNISLVLQNLGLLDRVSAMWQSIAETASQAIQRK